MSTSPGAAVLALLLVISLLAIACAASVAYSQGLASDGPINRNKTISDDDNGKTIHAARGDVLIVQLKETDPAQAWHYTGKGSFAIVGDRAREPEVSRHDFRAKVLGPGDLSFAMVDSRDGFVIGNFSVHVFLEEQSAGSKAMPYPLYRI